MSGNKPSAWLLLAIALLLLIARSSAGAQVHDIVPVSGSPEYRTAVEHQAFLLVNQYRKAHDLPPMVWTDSIAKVARGHSKDMATGEVDFGHDGFRDRIKRLMAVMTGFSGAGENVLMTTDMAEVAESAVALWLRSPHHLENIRGDYNYSGMGVWQDKDGMLYFTQIFMKFAPKTEEAETAPATGLVTPFGMLAAPNMRAKP